MNSLECNGDKIRSKIWTYCGFVESCNLYVHHVWWRSISLAEESAMKKLIIVTLLLLAAGFSQAQAADLCGTLSNYLNSVEAIGKRSKGDLNAHLGSIRELRDEYVTLWAKLHSLLHEDIKQFQQDAYGCGSKNPYGVFGPDQETCCERVKSGRAKIMTKCRKLSQEGLQ